MKLKFLHPIGSRRIGFWRHIVSGILVCGIPAWAGAEEVTAAGTGRSQIAVTLLVSLAAAAVTLVVTSLFFLARERRKTRKSSSAPVSLCVNCELLCDIAKLGNIEYFHFDRKNHKSTLVCDRYWPAKDGVPVEAADWVAGDDMAQFATSWKRMLNGEIQALRIEYRAGEAGRLRNYVMHVRRYHPIDENDASDQYFGLIQDVTELQTSIYNYQDTANLLRTIIENFPNPVMIKNVSDDFRCVMSNCNLAQQFGVNVSDTMGKTDFELFPRAEDAECIRRNDLLAVQSGGLAQCEEEFCDANAVRHYVLTTRSVISRTDGVKLLVAVVTDVSELKRIQQAAEESNEILRAVLENVHSGVTVKDIDRGFQYIVWNKWLADKTGFTSKQTLGKNDFEIPFTPEMQRYFRNEDQKTCEIGFTRVAAETVESDGRVSFSDITRKLLTLPWGKRLLITSVSDLTQERKLAREREQMIAQQNNYIEYERIINRCLQAITLQTDMEESIAFVLREIGENTRADRCYIFEFADDDIHVCNTHEWFGPDIAPQRETLQNVDLRNFIGFLRCLQNHEDIVISDLTQPQPVGLQSAADFFRRHPVRSVLVSGIWENGRLWGFVGIDFVKTIREFASSDIHIVRNAANLFLLLLERQSRIDALADSISLQTQIFDNISVPILLTDTQFNVIKTNTSMERVARAECGASGEHKCYHRFCEGRTKTPADCPIQQVLTTGEPCSIERVCGERHVQITAQPIYDRTGNLKYVLESGFNVTELRRQQEQLAVYLTQEQIVSECLKILVLKQDFNAALEDIILLLGKQLQMDCCAIFHYNAKDGVLYHVHRWELFGEETENRLQDAISEKDYPECFLAFRKGEHIRVDLRDEPVTPAEVELSSMLHYRKMQAIACTGIRFHHEFWGVVGMEFTGADKYFGPAEMRLLTSAARIIEVLLERETLYAKLLNSENEKNMIWELMTVPMVLFDADRNIIRVNPAMERLCGMSSAEIMSQPCFLTICKSDAPGQDCPITRILQDQKPQHLEFSLFGRDFDIFTLPVFENNTLVRILQIFIDITENNANKRKLLSAVDAAEAAARAKSTFLATMSHEIRTPLNAVIGFSELLQSGEVAPEEQLEYLRSINFAGNALLQLINDILDLSKLESGQMEIVSEKGDLYKLCEEMMAIFSLRAKEKHLDLQLDYPDRMPYLYFSASRLRQVLLNLIGNAIKFTPKGYIALAVHFQIRNETSGALRIEIRDTGLGIHDDYKSRIFQPFIQQNKVRGTQEGTGLGLAISKRLIEHMGGTLSFESTFGVGTSFVIELPEIRYCDGPQGDASVTVVNEPTRQGRKILLVDDVPLNLKVLLAMLKHFQADVVTAGSGSEALEKLEVCKPDLILTDMWMPEMNGAELADKIRCRAEFSETVIFAVTADSETGGSFAMDHFDGVLLKPVSLEKLQKMFRLIDHRELVPGSPTTI